MTDKEPSKQVLTPKARIAFPHLFEKETFKSGKPKYAVTLLFPKDSDLSGLQAAMKLAADEKWGNKKPRGLKTPLKDGDAVDKDGELKYPYDGYENCWALKASTEYDNFGIVDVKKDPITDPDEVYGGCYGRAFLQAFAYDTEMSRGVGFALIHFQKLADGESFGGSKISARDAFDDDLSQTNETDSVFNDADDGANPFGL